MSEIHADTRQQIIQFLPDALKTALDSYHRFSAGEIPEDSKGFSAHHNACKVAIAHIELLLKLAGWAFQNTKNSDDQTYKELQTMLQCAEAELNNYRNNQQTDDA